MYKKGRGRPDGLLDHSGVNMHSVDMRLNFNQPRLAQPVLHHHHDDDDVECDCCKTFLCKILAAAALLVVIVLVVYFAVLMWPNSNSNE